MHYLGFDKSEHFDRISLYHGDCMDLMRQTPDKYYDLAIVDPPFGIGFGEFNRTNKASNGERIKANKYKQGNWDDSTPNDDYFIELKRISKSQICFGGNYFIQLAEIETPNLKKKEDFIKYIENSKSNWFFWHKQNPVPNFADGELAWLSPDLESFVFDYRYYGNIEGNTSASKKYHPTQKPVGLYSFIINRYAKSNFKIIDTHLGSGSIALAIDKANKLDNMNLDFVGIELDTDYFNNGVNRFRMEHSQGCLPFE